MPKAHLDPTAPGGGINSSGTRTDEPKSDSGGAAPAPSEVTRAGFVALIGRPNVGKSTLLNCILGEKLAIVSPKPQTTRTRLLGIKNLPGAQLALVDTPGMHRPDGRGRTLLNRYMVDEALSAVSDVDVVLLMTDLDTQRAQKAAPPEIEPQGGAAPLDDATRAVRALLHPADRYVVQQLGNSGKPLVLAINKVDLLRDKKLLLPLIAEWNTLQNFRAIIPICAERGDGVDELLEVLCAAVPAGEALFPEDMLTDRAERFLVAELVREQVFLAAREELPYSVAVTIDGWEERIAPTGHRVGERIGVIIDATVHVEKANQKKIIVGEGGHMIRDLGIAARQAISELLGCGVHLSLFVRVDEEWTASPGGLRKMGYEAPSSLLPSPATNRRPTPAKRPAELQVKSPPPSQGATEAQAKDPSPPQRSTESKGPRSTEARGERPSHRADTKDKGPRSSQRSDGAKDKGSRSSQRSADLKDKGPRSSSDGPKDKGSRSSQRSDGPKDKKPRPAQRAADSKSWVKGPRPAPSRRGGGKTERGGVKGQPRHSSHTSHAGPGEHAK